MTAFNIIIPARLESSRFPEKVLVDIQGKPMLQHVYERARDSAAKEILIATDSKRIASIAMEFGAEVCLTAATHQSGTDRCAEAAAKQNWPAETIIVNVQGDEPLIAPENINQVAKNLAHQTCDIATLAFPVEDSCELIDSNVVKIVQRQDGMALYFSRSVIPFQRDQDAGKFPYERHIGLYAYTVATLQHLVNLPVAPLETVERLEQLRALWHGMNIHVATAHCKPGPSIDTPEDLQRLLNQLNLMKSN